MAGFPVTALADGVRMHSGGRELYFARASTPEYAAYCYRSKPTPKTDELYCSTGYQLSPGLGIIYDFRASEVGFEQRASEVDRMARELFDSLKAR